MPRVVIGLLVFLLPVAVRAERVQISLVARGGLTATASASHAADAAHFCSAAAHPWQAPDAPDERGPPYPFYRLVFGEGGPDADLARPGPSVALTLSNYAPDVKTHSDPVNDSIEVVLAGRHFVGHTDMQHPGFGLVVTYSPDGHGGALVAEGLRESGTGDATIDLTGAWTCPPVVATMNVINVTVHKLFPGAVPARPDPTPLRVTRSAIPCIDRGCAGWRVTDEDTGLAYLARVDLSRLQLATRLRQEAKQGEITLLIGGRLHPGSPPQVTALELQGVEPAPPAGVPEASVN